MGLLFSHPNPPVEDLTDQSETILPVPMNNNIPDWSELPEDLLKFIAERLDFLPYVPRFSAVCTAWRSAGSRIGHRLQHKPPLLMLPCEGHTRTRRFFSIAKEEVFSLHLPQVYRKWCCGSCKGWLVLVDAPTSEIKLLNLFSSVEVQLPQLTQFPYPEYFDRPEKPRNISFIHKAILSSDPKSSDCIVMAIVSENQLLCFCRPGENIWTAIETPYTMYHDLIHYKGLFYAIDCEGAVVAIYVSTGEPIVTVLIPDSAKRKLLKKKYFAESISGDLLLILRHLELEEPNYLNLKENKYRHGYHTVGFEVLKLDIAAKKKKFKVLHGIGDQILFVGHGSSISLLAHDLPGLRANTIYFADDNAQGYRSFVYGCHDMGIFSFDDSSIRPFSLNKSSWFDPLIWVTQQP